MQTLPLPKLLRQCLRLGQRQQLHPVAVSMGSGTLSGLPQQGKHK